MAPLTYMCSREEQVKRRAPQKTHQSCQRATVRKTTSASLLSVSQTKPEAIHLVFYSLRRTQNRQIDDINTTYLSVILIGTDLRGMS